MDYPFIVESRCKLLESSLKLTYLSLGDKLLVFSLFSYPPLKILISLVSRTQLSFTLFMIFVILDYDYVGFLIIIYYIYPF